MKVLFVGDSHTWMMSEDPSVFEHLESVRLRRPSPVKAGTTGFTKAKLHGNETDFLWKTGMNAFDAKSDKLKKMLDEYTICPCYYDYVVFCFGDMDIQFKGDVRSMQEAAEVYFNGVLSVMSEYKDKIIFKDPTTRMGSASDLYYNFMDTLSTLCEKNNLPLPIKSMSVFFDGQFESGDYIGHLKPKDSEMLKSFLLGYLSATAINDKSHETL